MNMVRVGNEQPRKHPDCLSDLGEQERRRHPVVAIVGVDQLVDSRAVGAANGKEYHEARSYIVSRRRLDIFR